MQQNNSNIPFQSFESCARSIHFSYAHRLQNHEGNCANLHGHNGLVWIHATPINGLDSIGRVVDFSILKEKVGGWIDCYWDHNIILNQDDKETIKVLKQLPFYHRENSQHKEIFLLDGNPTAEKLSSYLLWKVCPQVLKGHNIIVYKIEFWETPHSLAVQSLDPFSSQIRNLYETIAP